MNRFRLRRRYDWKSLIFVIILCVGGIAGALRQGRDDITVKGPFHAVDGDTLTIAGMRMRLRGLDAPELKQRCGEGESSWACGVSARKALQALAATNAVCVAHGKDKYRRRLVRCSGAGGDIGAAMVEAGLAVAYGDYEREEKRARAGRRGIWAGAFERPQDWRKAHRALSPAEERQEQRSGFIDED